VLRRPVEFAQYTSIRYAQRLAEERAVRSVGSKGDSYDNAAAQCHSINVPVAWFPHIHRLDTPRSVDIILAVAATSRLPYVGLMPEAENGNIRASSLTDVIGIGTLTRLVPRELVDEVIASQGRKELRKNKLPARVMVYFVMAMALFYGDAYEEVMRKLAGGLQCMGTWRRQWEMPGPGALCQARQRLGAAVMRELYECVAAPCAMRSTQGAWLGGRRLMALDGFGMEAPDSEENAAYFGYAGKKERCSFPYVQMAALAECGTHAIVAAAIGRKGEGEETLASRILSGVAIEPGMIVMVDAGLYSYANLRAVIDAGADALFRVGANVDLPVLEWLPDGSYRSYIADPDAKRQNSYRLRKGLAKITSLPGTHVRVVDYEITDRGDGDELITLVTNITDPDEITAIEMAAAYHERWEAELVIDELKTHQRGSGVILRSRKPEMVEQEIWGLLLTHYGIRHLMREAADQADLDPDRMSFIRALRVVRRQVTGQAAFSPSAAGVSGTGGDRRNPGTA
jgi:Insertion element 4 transposase N-terminal/Transposase DDE domain